MLKDSLNGIREGKISPGEILRRSSGEVSVPQTMDFQTGEPVKGGLFDEEIFGPREEWYDGEEMRTGHITLSAPVIPAGLLQGVPGRLSEYLGMDPQDLQDIVYYRSRVVTGARYEGQTDLRYGNVYSNMECLNYFAESGTMPGEMMSGPEAIETLLEDLGFQNEDIDLTGMIIKVIPVIPPSERPMLPLNDGRWVTSDLNDLYREIILANERVRKLIRMKVPYPKQIKERCRLQEAVDALLNEWASGRNSLN